MTTQIWVSSTATPIPFVLRGRAISMTVDEGFGGPKEEEKKRRKELEEEKNAEGRCWGGEGFVSFVVSCGGVFLFGFILQFRVVLYCVVLVLWRRKKEGKKKEGS